MADYLTEHFESTHQKVGTFKVVGGAKVGGNVAGYFCLADGTVVHAVAGPVKPAEFLREARWAVDLRKLAVAEAGGDVAKYRAVVRRGHAERFKAEVGQPLAPNVLPPITAQAPPAPQPGLLRQRNVLPLTNPAKVHLLLAYYPLAKLDQVYPVVFEDILKEKTSTLPVVTR